MGSLWAQQVIYLVFYNKYIFTLFVTIVRYKPYNLKLRSVFLTVEIHLPKIIKLWSNLKPFSFFIPQPCLSWHFVIIFKTLLQIKKNLSWISNTQDTVLKSNVPLSKKQDKVENIFFLISTWEKELWVIPLRIRPLINIHDFLFSTQNIEKNHDTLTTTLRDIFVKSPSVT